MLNIILVEDQEKQLNYLESLITKLDIEDYKIYKFKDAETMLACTEISTGYEIFLLDIVLTTQSGIELAQYINTHFKNSIIIFISGYLNKVTEIYDTNHFYFIYKPELEQRLPHVMNKALIKLQQLKTKLSLVLKGKTVILNVTDIYFLERTLRTTLIRTKNEVINCAYALDYFENILLQQFVKTHRSYIVNLDAVKIFSRTSLTLITDEVIPISRQYQKSVKKKWENYLLNNI